LKGLARRADGSQDSTFTTTCFGIRQRRTSGESLSLLLVLVLDQHMRSARRRLEEASFSCLVCPISFNQPLSVFLLSDHHHLGGEFSSLHQNSFHHYGDFWCFDVTSHTWDRIETKVRPSARSGHRMAMWKHFVVLFGGFYDPGVTSECHCS
jgi:Galactose oxidase, central domain